MNITGLVLVILITSLFIIGTLNTQSGGSASGWSGITIPLTNNVYSRQFNELDNVDFVLQRPHVPGNAFIDTMMPVEEGTNTLYTLPKKPVEDIKPAVVTQDTKVTVETKQPYFLNEALIVSYYGVPHYWDFRYPRQPISVEFAKDPEKFVREHPDEYPSYVIKSRNYSQLEPFDPAAV